jgi:superfamily II DNA or RNA helicase
MQSDYTPKTYDEFIAKKSLQCKPRGIPSVYALNPQLFPHQRDVILWALRLGKAAAFLGTGLGKTLIELEWARVVSEHTDKPVLVLAPLAVAKQTVREATKFGIAAHYCATQDDVTCGINVTNYERLEKFDPRAKLHPQVPCDRSYGCAHEVSPERESGRTAEARALRR